MADVIISESKLEDMLYNHLNGNNVSAKIDEHLNHKAYEIVIRQLNLSPYGIADIVGFFKPDFDGSICVDIIELKKGCIDTNTFKQALKYRAGLIKYADLNDFEFGQINITLIGSEVKIDSYFELIPSALDFVYFYSYDIDINHGLTLNDENSYNFSESLLERNFDKLFTCLQYAEQDGICNFNKMTGVN